MNILSFLFGNKTLIKISLFAALLGMLFVSVKRCSEAEKEAERYSNNQTALMTETEQYKTESGKNAAKVIELEMTKGEFEKLCREQKDVIKDMELKIKRLELVSTTVSSTEVSMDAVLMDTVVRVVNDTTVIDKTLKTFSWSDKWNHIDGIIDSSNIHCNYIGYDTLTIAVTKVPKKFLFFRWGCKYYEVNLVHQNESSKILYNRTIKLK